MVSRPRGWEVGACLGRVSGALPEFCGCGWRTVLQVLDMSARVGVGRPSGGDKWGPSSPAWV